MALDKIGMLLTGYSDRSLDRSGIAFCPFDHCLISLDRPGIWKFTKDFIPVKPVIYLNLYNNQWNTNYRYWYPGTWSSKVRIWTFTKNSTVESRLVTPSLEARTPLMVLKLMARQATGSYANSKEPTLRLRG